MKIQCPHCDRELAASEEHRGMEVECPLCSNSFVVPAVNVVVRKDEKQPGKSSDCPYCRSAIIAGEDFMACPVCSTLHHKDCWEENGGCTIYGCKMAPPDEEKINLVESDATGNASLAAIPGAFDENQGEGMGATGPQARPWVRYWARIFDTYLFSLPFAMMLAAFMPEILNINDIIFGAILVLAYTFFEAGLLTSWGTTPGKALLGVRLRKADGSKPTYGEALSRSMSVWAGGMGCGIPIITLITQIRSYNKLSSVGITSWDEDGGYKVTHMKVGVLRWLAVIVVLFVLLILISMGESY